jgi:predicted naringenin-chalcone synthase
MEDTTSAPSIRAIGTALPPYLCRQSEMADLMCDLHGLNPAQSRRLRVLYGHSRIDTRFSCLADVRRSWEEYTFFPRHPKLIPPPPTSRRMQAYREYAPVLARAACEDLFRQPGAVSPEEIDHIFVVSCTGFFAPGLDVLLTQSLGLRPDVGRTLIGFQGCQGGLTGLRLADYLCRARPRATALLVCVELCTLHFQNEPTEENLLANALFADGASAALVSGPEVPRARAAASHPPPELRVLGTKTYLRAGTLEEMVWTVGDTGFELKLSSLIPQYLSSDVPQMLNAVFEGWRDLRETGIWAIHPGGSAILDGLEKTLALPADRLRHSREVLRACGNLSSATIHFVLRRVQEDPALSGPGIALAFGPGLTVEAARFEKIVPAPEAAVRG